MPKAILFCRLAPTGRSPPVARPAPRPTARPAPVGGVGWAPRLRPVARPGPVVEPQPLPPAAAARLPPVARGEAWRGLGRWIRWALGDADALWARSWTVPPPLAAYAPLAELPGLGKTVLVTGGTSGIGLYLTQQLLAAGFNLVAVVRSPERGRQAFASLPEYDTVRLQLHTCDLSVPSAVVELTGLLNKAYPKIDVALISQGVMHHRRTTVVDPVTGRANEANFTTNAVTPNLLICGIQSLLARGRDGGRVVHVSSDAHRSLATAFDGNNIEGELRYSQMSHYGDSKLHALAFSRAMARRRKSQGATIEILSVDPGLVDTDLGRYMARDVPAAFGHLMVLAHRLFAQSVASGAEPVLRAVLAPPGLYASGTYFKRFVPSLPSAAVNRPEILQALQLRTCAMLPDADSRRAWQASLACPGARLQPFWRPRHRFFGLTPLGLLRTWLMCRADQNRLRSEGKPASPVAAVDQASSKLTKTARSGTPSRARRKVGPVRGSSLISAAEPRRL